MKNKIEKKTIDWYGKQVMVPFDCAIYQDKEINPMV